MKNFRNNSRIIENEALYLGNNFTFHFGLAHGYDDAVLAFYKNSLESSVDCLAPRFWRNGYLGSRENSSFLHFVVRFIRLLHISLGLRDACRGVLLDGLGTSSRLCEHRHYLVSNVRMFLHG